ncbi:MAG: ATP-binding cassette domain-containing protein, partial [Clostridia bacterium]
MREVKVRFRHVKKFFPYGGFLHKAFIHAVNDVSFDIKAGEVLAVVGESGCGKTTMARMLMKLHEPTGGTIEVDGRDISQVKTREDVKKWHANIQMIFQDPFASLNPAKTIENIIGRTLTLHFPSL